MTALVQSKRLAREYGGAKAGLSEALDYVGAEMAAHYPGSLLLVDAEAHAEAINKQAEPLAEILNGSQHSYLIALIARTIEAKTAQSDFFVTGDQRTTVTIELTVIPLSGANSFLVLGRDITLEKNLREALVESRKRYKELIECSSDFVWEADSDGRFAFVTSLGALGYTSDMLVGRSARSMVDRRNPVPEPFPFETRQPVDRAEVWLRDSSGEPACLLVSSVPMFSQDKEHLGARGVCRDVTEERRRDEALAKIRVREALFATMVRTIRDEEDPERMLNTAARVLAEGFSALACVIFRADAENKLREAASFGQMPGASLAQLLDELESGVSDVELSPASDEVRAMACPTRYQSQRNGVICISRADRRRWSTDERALLAGVAERVGIAIQQADAKEELIALSRTDSLTGLYNRRAFVESVEQIIEARSKSGHRAALIYVDLNNFKSVNDTFGHIQGDAALKAAAQLMADSAQADDLVGRIGGDEFALWLEVEDQAEAEKRAADLAELSQGLSEYSKDLPAPFGMAIGIALFEPDSDEEIDELFARADHAMYAAKRDAEQKFILAPPADKVAPQMARNIETERSDGAVR
ncbi:MAG: diguanylate cyclase [Rhodospirillaceae bacterium]|nr:diguanylate cyclase [Rhodospirillaceae bacterium]MBT5780949.1 diguanylate cyclase [Rhodospirillaceae bacterium]